MPAKPPAECTEVMQTADSPAESPPSCSGLGATWAAPVGRLGKIQRQRLASAFRTTAPASCRRNGAQTRELQDFGGISDDPDAPACGSRAGMLASVLWPRNREP